MVGKKPREKMRNTIIREISGVGDIEKWGKDRRRRMQEDMLPRLVDLQIDQQRVGSLVRKKPHVG